MRAGQVSVTAQRVAAVRLGFDRVPAAYGDPAADLRLAADVAGHDPGPVGERMAVYLRYRTAFFDHTVVKAIGRGIGQIVAVAAGYDGRALRYAAPGVRWFEVDHPDTQQDKRSRLDALGIDAAAITFVPADLTVDHLDDRLLAAGLHPELPTLVLCEGLAVYLTYDDLAALLRRVRQVSAPGSVLAISLSVATAAAVSDTRRQFRAAVAAVGEPARSTLTAEQAETMFAATGWVADAPDPGSPRRRLAGLVIARPA